MASLPSTSQQTICPICKQNPTKYTCPGCSTPTCSLSCSKGHKSQTGCSGQRNQVAYVPMNKYGWGQMMNDYTYLEEVGRRATDLKGKTKDHANFKKGKNKRDILQSYLAAQGIDMEQLPLGMSRRKLNQSTFDVKCVQRNPIFYHLLHCCQIADRVSDRRGQDTFFQYIQDVNNHSQTSSGCYSRLVHERAPFIVVYIRRRLSRHVHVPRPGFERPILR